MSHTYDKTATCSCARCALVPGSRWRENDPRKVRIVEVIKVGIADVMIRTVETDGNPGTVRVTETKANRFGRRGRNGFTLVGVPDFFASKVNSFCRV